MQREHRNQRVAKQLWTAIAESDADAIRDVLADEIVWTVAGANPLSGCHRGHRGVLDFLARTGEAADEFTTSVKSIFHNEEGAVIYHTATARRPGKSLEMDYFLLLLISRNKVVSALSVATDQHTDDEFWNP